MDLGQLFAIIIGAIFVSNFVLSRFLGLCPFVGVSKDPTSALGMGMAVIFVMTMASLVTWFVYVFVLEPLGITYLRTIAFILIIATLVQFVEMVIEKTSPTLHKSLGILLGRKSEGSSAPISGRSSLIRRRGKGFALLTKMNCSRWVSRDSFHR